MAKPVDLIRVVPFKEIWISPQASLIIKYNNVDQWDAIICGCSAEQTCTSYIARWKFKTKNKVSHGPNYLKWLELYLGQPPESPPQNADQIGEIKVNNTGTNSFPFSCDFSSLGPSFSGGHSLANSSIVD